MQLADRLNPHSPKPHPDQLSVFQTRLDEAEDILDNTPVALYIEPAETLEQEIWFLKEIREMPYPVAWFEQDGKRTHAIYKDHYRKWQREFVKTHVTYIKAKQHWEWCLKQVENEKGSDWPC